MCSSDDSLNSAHFLVRHALAEVLRRDFAGVLVVSLSDIHHSADPRGRKSKTPP